jgi:hypothetical protein
MPQCSALGGLAPNHIFSPPYRRTAYRSPSLDQNLLHSLALPPPIISDGKLESVCARPGRGEIQLLVPAGSHSIHLILEADYQWLGLGRLFLPGRPLLRESNSTEVRRSRRQPTHIVVDLHFRSWGNMEHRVHEQEKLRRLSVARRGTHRSSSPGGAEGVRADQRQGNCPTDEAEGARIALPTEPQVLAVSLRAPKRFVRYSLCSTERSLRCRQRRERSVEHSE